MGKTTTGKAFVKAHGCQMNVYDSERMAEILGSMGYEQSATPGDADIILLNTCHIREKAAEKVYSELGRYKPFKKARPNLLVGVAGCVAQAEGEEIVRRQPLVDFVVGPQAYHRLPDLIARAARGEKQLDIEFPIEDKFDHLVQERAGSRPRRRSPSAFLTVQEGCDKFCTFCVVPYTRGAEFSRPVSQVMAEARDLVSAGVVEVTLLGQNVNAYHGEGPDQTEWSLGSLIRELSKIDELRRIRFTTSHPRDMDDDLIAAFADTEKLMPYLHLPIQSGSDRILQAMNRRHTVADYRRLIGRIRKARPDIAISGDFIVGFPGETDADFDRTLELCEDIRYAHAFSFKYSPRPGTPAAEREQLDRATKSERLSRLQRMLTRHQRQFRERMSGQTLPVLLERTGRLDGQLVGRSPHMIPVHLIAPKSLIGQIADVRILRSEPNSLAGTLE